MVLRRPVELAAEIGEVNSFQNHIYDDPTNQALTITLGAWW
jgi:hypothetical protein